MLSIVSWNVNSIRSRLPHLIEFIKAYNPDVICLQETKVTNDIFPNLEIEDLGYNIAINGQKSYNGVAILSKYQLDDVVISLDDNSDDEQARYIEAVISVGSHAIRVISAYIPNGQALDSNKFIYKMNWLNRFNKRLQQLLSYEEVLVVSGDYNIAPQPIDVYDPKHLHGQICFSLKEREQFYALENIGLYDAYRILHPTTQEYSWWDYRGSGFRHDKGMRIDHHMISTEAVDKLVSCKIISDERGKEKPSDHAPVVLELDV